MEKNVQSGQKESEAEVLASEMMEGFGSIPIIDKAGRLIGIVSEFDLLNVLRKGKKLREITAGEIMTPNPVSVTQNTDVVTVIEVLQSNHLIRVPVVDSTGKLIGILARRDILRGYLQTAT
jgi:CBS domain-containing protein